VRHLVLNAPQRRNALDVHMLRELAEAVRNVANDKEARALVVSGSGRAFCAGADVTNLFGDLDRPVADIRNDLKEVYAGFLGLRDLKIPTIAAVDGPAVGAGANIAFACDIVFAGNRARFAITFADIGLHPGGGCTWFLTRRLGAARALEVLLEADSLDAEAAARHGLVARVIEDPTNEALEFARRASLRDPDLVRDMKRTVQVAEAAEFSTVLELESWAQAASAKGEKFRDYVASFGG
jgi:enoyl-CoA hydratase